MRRFNFCSFYQKIMYTTRPVQQKVERERKSREREKAGERGGGQREGKRKDRGREVDDIVIIFLSFVELDRLLGDTQCEIHGILTDI